MFTFLHYERRSLVKCFCVVRINEACTLRLSILESAAESFNRAYTTKINILHLLSEMLNAEIKFYSCLAIGILPFTTS
ncbi:MAG: hypothetical protein QNJ54_01780 [Prochloraceae cyanobacterium]|nr:hypothetical protein [Prochloraceae cyanobacterium]